MDVRCSVCGEDNPARARFCLACGSPIVPAADEAAGSIEFARETRRTLSVVFADVVGFTSVGERLDSESLRRVMDRFYAEMRAAIEAQGGTVAKFIGDAVMAVWGTPEVREDDALRAVRAADDMRAALRALNEDLDRRWGVRLGLRTGINTGEVVVDPAQGADLLVGDTLNVAARLEQAAADGDVLLGPDTARLVRHEADLEPVAPLVLKGISRPLPAWRLRSARPGERPRASRLQAPLVGREREVAHLRSAFYGTAAARETRLISVIGSPGVGKSRLVADFVAGIGHEALVLTARCEPAAQAATFLPLAGVIRAAAGIDEPDEAAEAQAKLAAVLPPGEERELIAARAAGIAGLGPEVGVEESFWAVRRFLEGLAEAREQPVVLVVDDVQWAQPMLLDLHQHLARWGREAPVLVVAVARPEIRELCPPLATAGDVAMDVIEVGPLGARESRTLVDRLLGAADLPAPLADRVLETTEGNPLFLSETLRMLVDEGVLRRDDGRWTVEPDASATGVAVPPTIQALLGARIERLTPGERLAIERAAVIGQRFTAPALAELLGPGARDGLDECLEGLRRKELVAREPAPPAEGPVFRFQHALIRDAAYRSLLKEARADLHERHAAWLATRPGEHDEAIGFHLERAHAYRHQLGPLDDRGRALGRRGAERLHAAARRALAREDLRAAADLLTRALAALDGDEPERRTALLPDLAEALLSAGKTAAAEPIVEELIVRAEGDPRLEAWATVFACQLSNLAGGDHVRETIGRVRRAATVLAAHDDHAGEAKAHHVVAVAHASLGQIAPAEVALDRALVAAREAGDARRVTAVLSGAPQAAVRGPSPIVRASGRCLDVVRILRMTPGNRPVEAAALRCQAVLEAMRGRFTAARGIVDGCRATLEELGLTYELHELGVHAGTVELLAGDASAAEVELWEAKQGFATLGVESGAAQAAALLARALLDQGRVEDAEAETRFAELRGGEDLKTAIAWRGARAEALARRGEYDAALALARRAIELSEPTDALADKADAHMALAAVLREAGREEEARDAAIAARDLYAAKDHAVGRARAEAAAGLPPSPPRASPALALLAARGRDPEGERLLAEWARLATAGDYDGLRAMYAPGDDYVMDDRRHLTNDGLQYGVEAGIETVRSVNRMSLDVDWHMEPGPGRAEDDTRVASGLCRVSGRIAETEGRFEADYGIVIAVRDGLIREAIVTDADDAALLGAYDEVCARQFGPPAAGETAVERTHAKTIACLNEQRWDDLRALYVDEMSVADLRAVGSPPARGADAVVAMLRDIREFLPDVRWRDEVLAVRGDQVAVTRTELSGHSADGGDVAMIVWQVILVDPDGRLRRAELFDNEPDALARLKVVAAWCRGVADAGARLSRRDWAAVDGRYDAHLRVVDHRAGLRDTSEGIEAFWDPVFEQTGDLRVSISVLDARTDRLCAVRMNVEGTTLHGGRFEQVVDEVVSVDEAAIVTSIEMYDPGDPALEARLDELEREALASGRPRG